MTSEKKDTPAGEDKETIGQGFPRILFVLIPLLLLGFGLGVWLLVRGQPTVVQQTPVAESSFTRRPEVAEVVDVPGDGFGMVAGLATPWAVPGGPGEVIPVATDTPVPPVATPVVISLLGPPPGSVFRLGDVVSFYWSAAGMAGPNQSYVLYLDKGGRRVPVATIVEPNLGQGYQWQTPAGEFVEEAGNYSWLVVLEDTESGAIIGQSASRPLLILDDN